MKTFKQLNEDLGSEMDKEVRALFKRYSKDSKTRRYEEGGFTAATVHQPSFKRDLILGTTNPEFAKELKTLEGKYAGKLKTTANHGTAYSVYTYSR